jgi:hypothetical protein
MPETVPVSVDDFIRAESDTYIRAVTADHGVGVLVHRREPASVDDQTVVRMNRDTLYSHAVCDLDAGPVTIRLPDPGPRYQALQVINQDHLTKAVVYGPAERTLTREAAGTRYVVAVVRTLADPQSSEDMRAAHALQDAVALEQASPGVLELPDWDQGDLGEIREGLKILGRHEPGMERTFGDVGEIDPVRHLVGTAIAWGGNPSSAALYLNITPEQNDGKTVHRLTLKDVPVDGFWSVSLYNAEGFFQKNSAGAYSVNSLTAQASPNGSVTIQFGGCDRTTPNCLPIMPGWNYIVRLYRPRRAILEGRWTAPAAKAVT